MMQRTAITTLLAAISAYAQLTRGYISGTVLDPSGVAAAGVTVVATSRTTNLAHPAETNDAGVYRIAGLEPGAYDLRLSKTGLETVLIEGIAVDSAAERVVNRVLALQQQSTAVVVSGAPAGVELSKASAAIDRTLGPAVLEKVPLRGTLSRDITNLMALGPAVVRVPAKPEFNYVAAGQRLGRTEFLADGLDNRSGLDYAVWRPLPEQVAEFQVKTNAYSAEFGRTSGVVVSVISRAGGNRLHGSLWDYYSADWMAAQTLANKRAGLPLGRFQEHHAGASLGGPVRRDRTFFYGVFQARPLSAGPSAAQSALVVIPTRLGYDALTRVPLGPGQSIESRQAILSGLSFLGDVYPRIARQDPLGALPVNGVPIEIGAALVPAPNDALALAASARLDHRLTNRDHLTLRWQQEHWREDLAQGGRAALSNRLFGPLFAARDVGSQSSILASLTHLLGPAAVNEFRVGAVTNPFDAAPSGQSGPFFFVPGLFAAGAYPVNPWHADSLQLQAQDVLTLQRGRHGLKFGVDMLRIHAEGSTANYTRGLWRFPTMQDLLNNQADLLLYRRDTPVVEKNQLQQAFFLQDDIRATPSLTVNLGLRYQTAGTPLAAYGATAPELLAAGIPKPARRDTNDLAPRVGFAWSMSQQTVLRGGFGVAYEQALYLPNFVTYPQQIQAPLPPPFTYGLFPSIPAFLPGEPPLLPQVFDFVNPSPDARNATTHFYSLSLQREFGRSHFFEVGYLGNRAYHLFRFNETNPLIDGVRLNPAWAARGIWETAGSSVYNAAFVRFDRRLAHGLMFGLNYTWSTSTDDGQGPPQDTRNRPAASGFSALLVGTAASGRLGGLANWRLHRVAVRRAVYRHDRSRQQRRRCSGPG
jgi:hypothetical protein